MSDEKLYKSYLYIMGLPYATKKTYEEWLEGQVNYFKKAYDNLIKEHKSLQIAIASKCEFDSDWFAIQGSILDPKKQDDCLIIEAIKQNMESE